MKYLKIAGLDVSAVSLGLANIGAGISEPDSFRLMDAYLDMGGNFMDTARVYSDWVPGESGRSERVLGDWLAARGNRNRVVVATKGAHPRLDSMTTPRMSPAEVGCDLDLSLKALRTDVIDLYYLHRDDRGRPVGEILDMLEGFARVGKIRQYACSNWSAHRMLEAHEYAKSHGLQGFAANQIFWNMGSAGSTGLADTTCEMFTEEMGRAFRSTGMVAAAFTSQAGGFFTKLDRGDDMKDSMYYTPANLLVYNKAKEIAVQSNSTIADIVLNYILSQPIPNYAVVGCWNSTQLGQTMAAADKPLTAKQLEELEQVINKQ